MIEEITKLLKNTNVAQYRAIQPRLWAEVCKKQREYLEAREKYRYPPNDPKIKGEPKLTDFDRQTMLNAQTAPLLHDYELLKGYYEIISNRINLTKELK